MIRNNQKKAKSVHSLLSADVWQPLTDEASETIQGGNSSISISMSSNSDGTTTTTATANGNHTLLCFKTRIFKASSLPF